MRRQTSIFLILIGLLFLAGCGGTTPAAQATPTSPLQSMLTPTTSCLEAGATVAPTPSTQTTPTAGAPTMTEFALPDNGDSAQITAGRDGNIWLTDFQSCRIRRITPAGQITESPLPQPEDNVWAITAGPDGNLWFTISGSTQLGRITPAGKVTLFPYPQPHTALGGLLPVRMAISGSQTSKGASAESPGASFGEEATPRSLKYPFSIW